MGLFTASMMQPECDTNAPIRLFQHMLDEIGQFISSDRIAGSSFGQEVADITHRNPMPPLGLPELGCSCPAGGLPTPPL